MLIGTLGLGIVFLRNMLERKQELVLLKALGFRKKTIFRLIFIENLFLLLTGLVCGILAAYIGILPSYLSTAFTSSGVFVIFLIAAVFVTGVLCIYFLARSILKKQLISSLRNE